LEGSKILITGANGQLGRALSYIYPDAVKTDASDLDITSLDALQKFDWSRIQVIINAAGYTDVDGAETPEGGKLAWAINDQATGNLADLAHEKDLVLVHISTAYVFDGRQKIYKEDDPVNPLGQYAKSKTAGDARVLVAPKHYIVRTDSVIGEGKNFVLTMLGLGKKGIAPKVVADQIIRPTFTTELARAIKFLIEKPADFGTYNLTNEGERVSWADFTREIFTQAKIDLAVTDTTYREYSAGKSGVAPRPLNSVLDLTKIESAGFTPRDWHENLQEYIEKELAK
jgi:dTDP-4-dehydrorhamnose 3,5-epimerase/reductase